MSGSAAQGPSTPRDFYAISDDERYHELIDGEITRKASPSGEHADAQGGVLSALRGPFQRKPDRGGPGGWWIHPEPEVLLETTQIVRPDVAGWRRDRVGERPTGTPIDERPDWICEVLSPSNANNDTVRKLRLYHRVALTHYWIVDPRTETLTVLRWSADGYVTRLTAERGETVRPEPFEAIELKVAALFGEDPD